MEGGRHSTYQVCCIMKFAFLIMNTVVYKHFNVHKSMNRVIYSGKGLKWCSSWGVIAFIENYIRVYTKRYIPGCQKITGNKFILLVVCKKDGMRCGFGRFFYIQQIFGFSFATIIFLLQKKQEESHFFSGRKEGRRRGTRREQNLNHSMSCCPHFYLFIFVVVSVCMLIHSPAAIVVILLRFRTTQTKS